MKLFKKVLVLGVLPFVCGFTVAGFQEDLSKKIFNIKLTGLQVSQTLQLLQYTKQVVDNPEKLTVIEKNNLSKSLDSVIIWINTPVQQQLRDTVKKVEPKKNK